MHTEFAALLARAGVSQAAFARLAGLTPRQVNNWARGRAAVPAWAGLLAVILQDHSPEALTIMLEETAAAHSMTEANTDTPLPHVLAGQSLTETLKGPTETRKEDRQPGSPKAPSFGGSGSRRAAATEATPPCPASAP
jgi:transcriptional regulator with XRE-family HTH domain